MRIKLLCFAIAAFCLVSPSCKRAAPEGGPVAGGTIDLAVTGILDEFRSPDTRSSLVNNIRVAWEQGDEVLVFDASDCKYLGSLQASIIGGDDRQAVLSGTIYAPSGSNLHFIHGTGITGSSFMAGNIVTSVSLPLASQTGKTPFMVVGEAPVSAIDMYGSSVADLVVQFRFASSVITTYVTGLPASQDISSIFVDGLNTKCNVSVYDLGVGGSDLGTITIASPGKSNAKGQACVEIAVPAAPHWARTAAVYVGDTSYMDSFSSAELSAGYSYSTVVETLKGGLIGTFSVSSKAKVHFSQGNLQATFNGSSYDWGIAPHQFDYVGGSYDSDDGFYTGNNRIGSQQAGDVLDTFGWVGASSTELVSDSGRYGISALGSSGMASYGTVYPEELKADWGKAVDGKGRWRTLSGAEWEYLVEQRTGADSKLGFATVGESPGIIILPDSYKGPSIVSIYTPGWNSNVFTAENWKHQMEPFGAVFLPAAGCRVENIMSGVGHDVGGLVGMYWSSTSTSVNGYSFGVYFTDSQIVPKMNNLRYCALPVRLVTDAD